MSDDPVLRAGSATHVGQVRSINQDDLLVADRFFAVADGMGGHQGGEVASELAVESLSQSADDFTSIGELTEGIQAANQLILEQAAADPDLTGMGTTVCALALLDGFNGTRLALANVGDSRVYVLRDGDLEQLTFDHSLVAELLRDGRITEDEAEHHPRKNVVTRALGVSDPVDVDTWELPLVVGERFLLCSDGLFNEVIDSQIEAVLRRLADPTDAAEELVRLANEGGGRDNITVLIVDVVDAGSAPAVLGAGTASSDDPAGFAASAGEDEPEVGSSDASLDRAPAVEPNERPAFFTWRTAIFAAALIGVMVAAVWAVGLFARGTYFVGIDPDDDQLVIYKGRPGGVLWFDPTVEEVTVLTLSDVPEGRHAELEAGVDYASLASARAYVINLTAEIEALEPPPTSAPVTIPTITLSSPATAGTTTSTP